MTVAVVVGARPNFIKVWPLVEELDRRSLDYSLIHTGQHYDHSMDQIFFDELDITSPDIVLRIGSGTHAQQTGKALIELESVFSATKPDIVIVVGDVNSTLAGALAAVKLNIKVAHIEAGYRSFDRRMPEEINRIIVDAIADYLFVPTLDAADNLKSEGINEDKIYWVGNIMAETLLGNINRIEERKAYERFGVKAGHYILATIHRPENVDRSDKLKDIISALSGAPIPVIFPLHPRTAKSAAKFGIMLDGSITTTEPMGYIDTLSLLANACLIVTDSGGIQEEACILQIACLTVRENTERMATIAAGANKLVSSENLRDCILKWTSEKNSEELGLPYKGCWKVPPLWDEHVSERIVDYLECIYLSKSTIGESTCHDQQSISYQMIDIE